jgi:hypothetical protein
MRSLVANVDVRVLDEEMRLYRACASSADGVDLDSFRSHYELKRPPRGPENRATVIHMALSMFEGPEPCWNLIERTRGKLGNHVAELRLTPGRGICVAKTAGPLHWSVWARPEVLHEAVAALRAQ